MTERMIWGPGPYPTGSKPLGVIRHPADNMQGVAILMPTGIIVHGAAGVIRLIAPQSAAAQLGALGGAAGTPAQNSARARNAKLGGWPKGRPRKPTTEV